MKLAPAIVTAIVAIVTCDVARSDVSCGNHIAQTCSSCPLGHGAAWCHGDCYWNQRSSSCISKRGVSCGNHQANSCASCPQGNGAKLCNGDCKWSQNTCVLKGTNHGSFASGQLSKHNQYRRKHGAGPLRLDDSLNSGAQSHADYLARKGNWLSSSDHADLNGIGENIALDCSSGNAPSGDSATDSWYEEVYDYNYNNPGFSPDTGHFTQVVWKNSRNLGIAKAKGKAFKDGRTWQCTWIVGRYKPAGNYQGQYQKNVGRP